MIELVFVHENPDEHGHSADDCAEDVHLANDSDNIRTHVVLHNGVEANNGADKGSLDADVHCVHVEDGHNEDLHVHLDELPVVVPVLVLPVHEAVLHFDLDGVEFVGVAFEAHQNGEWEDHDPQQEEGQHQGSGVVEKLGCPALHRDVAEDVVRVADGPAGHDGKHLRNDFGLQEIHEEHETGHEDKTVYFLAAKDAVEHVEQREYYLVGKAQRQRHNHTEVDQGYSACIPLEGAVGRVHCLLDRLADLFF